MGTGRGKNKVNKHIPEEDGGGGMGGGGGRLTLAHPGHGREEEENNRSICNPLPDLVLPDLAVHTGGKCNLIRDSHVCCLKQLLPTLPVLITTDTCMVVPLMITDPPPPVEAGTEHSHRFVVFSVTSLQSPLTGLDKKITGPFSRTRGAWVGIRDLSVTLCGIAVEGISQICIKIKSSV